MANALTLRIQKADAVACIVRTTFTLTLCVRKKFALTLCVQKANTVACIVRTTFALTICVPKKFALTVSVCKKRAASGWQMPRHSSSRS